MIKHLRIKNFKSLLDVDVELSPVTVLAGRSGAGKTNFVEAIGVLCDLVAQGTQQNINGVLAHAGGWERIGPANLRGRPCQIQWNLTFDVPTMPGLFEYRLSLETTQPRVADESLAHDGTVLYHQADRKWTVPPAVAGVPQPGSVMFGWLTGLPEINIAYLSLAKGIGCHNFPGDVLTGEAKPPPGGFERLNKSGSNAHAVIDGILGSIQSLGNWREIEDSLKKLSSSLVGLTTAPQPPRVAASFKLGGQVVSLSLAEQSEGFRRFLVHLLAIYQNQTRQVVVFEEPEKGIFPGAMALLADHIKAASEKLHTQFILTTHSPQLLDEFAGEDIRWVSIADSGTQIAPLPTSEVAAIRDRLMAPSEILTVADPGQPEMVGG